MLFNEMHFSINEGLVVPICKVALSGAQKFWPNVIPGTTIAHMADSQFAG